MDPETRERIESRAFNISLARASGEPVGTKDCDIVALVNHIKALDARAENYARIFSFIDKFADNHAEMEEGVMLDATKIGKSLQKIIQIAIAPDSEEEKETVG